VKDHRWISVKIGQIGLGKTFLTVPEDIIRPVLSVSALTWFIRYIYAWNLQFL